MHRKKKIPLVFGVPQASFFETFEGEELFVAELRPGLEGARAVARRCLKRGLRPIIICDNMLAYCMKEGLVSQVFIFYDRMGRQAALCRCGSMIAAVCAKLHNIPVFLYPASQKTPGLPGDKSSTGCHCMASPGDFHPSQRTARRASSLAKIAGVRVTSDSIKTYVPLQEEVPLSFIAGQYGTSQTRHH